MAEKKSGLKSDLARADARGVTAGDLEEIPEATEAEFAGATSHVGGVPVRRGRPLLAEPKRKAGNRTAKRGRPSRS
jgi:hypothetical protein